MTALTKANLLKTYREKLLARYGWAKDIDKLDRFMASVEATLQGGNTFDRRSETFIESWRALGGKGKPTLKVLHGLPN